MSVVINELEVVPPQAQPQQAAGAAAVAHDRREAGSPTAHVREVEAALRVLLARRARLRAT